MVTEAGAELEGPSGRPKYDDLLSNPTSDAQAAGHMRASAEYKQKGDRFRLATQAFDRQYAHIYFQRLMLMKPPLLTKVRQKWPGVQLANILTLPENDEVLVVGTVYKDMKLKPSILDEYVKDRGASQLVGRTKFIGADDSIILEDESARMKLRGEGLPVGQLVTGVVMAVKGVAAPGGDFQVNAFCFANMAPQAPLPSLSEDKYVALVSGLGVGDDAADPLKLSLLVDYLVGSLASDEEQTRVSKIVRVVVAGGLLKSTEGLLQATTHKQPRQQAAALAPIREVDMCLSELAGAVPVEVMPGNNDPANHSLPQQPLHRCLFPLASSFTSFNRVTNPHEFEVDGISFLGTSGQNLDDIYKYSVEENRLTLLQRVLEWGHLVPTAPDTLTCYPLSDSDPFILQSAPHVFFVGNQPAYSSQMVTGPEGQKVLLISLPRFSSSGSLILVNLKSLAVHPIQFDADISV
ncbi:TPA: hypothetical protein ACH3X2_008775 [Trebouxia sp. C0005]